MSAATAPAKFLTPEGWFPISRVTPTMLAAMNTAQTNKSGCMTVSTATFNRLAALGLAYTHGLQDMLTTAGWTLLWDLPECPRPGCPLAVMREGHECPAHKAEHKIHYSSGRAHSGYRAGSWGGTVEVPSAYLFDAWCSCGEFQCHTDRADDRAVRVAAHLREVRHGGGGE